MLGRAISLAAAVLISLLHSGQSAADLTPIRHDRAPGVLIFVHGITGDSASTWTNPDSNAYWPDIVKDDPVFDGLDILTYDYQSSLFKEGMSVQGIADQMHTMLLDTEFRLDDYERIYFLAHSLGGVITRRLLLADEVFQDRVKGIFLFSTPMEGSSLATIAKLFGNNPVVNQLRRQDDADSLLKFIRNDWIKSELSLRIPAFCAFEVLGTGVGWFRTRIVEESSASRLCTSGLHAIQRDHSGIVKPASAGDHIHKLLRRWYSDINPDAEQALTQQEEEYPVVIARCDVDRYGLDLLEPIGNELQVLGHNWRMTRWLPQDWEDRYRSLLWQRHEPTLMIIHLSCFQQGPGSEAAYAERTRDFIKLLETLSDSKVKLLVYSGAFQTDPNFVANHIPKKLASKYIGEARLFLLPLKYGQSFATDKQLRDEFRSLVEAAVQ